MKETNTMKNTKTISRIESILSSGVTVEGKLPIGSFVETKNGKRQVVQHVTKRSTIITLTTKNNMNTTVKNKMPSGNLVIRYSSIRDLYEVKI